MNSTLSYLADLLEYPGPHWSALLVECTDAVNPERPESPELLEFHDAVSLFSLAEIQEIYVRTFELNPVTTLEAGYHLFGESYKRGMFLANLREMESGLELGQERQLPDYLPVLLRLLVHLEPGELRETLATDCMIPAIEKMLKPLNEAANPYADLLAAMHRMLSSERADAPTNSLHTEPIELTPCSI
jgi:nitrate reductase delta subunit